MTLANERKEMNICPQWVQDELTRLGGKNPYDEPVFRIWWSQYGAGDGSFRSGGVWSVDEQYFKGYRDLLRASGEPCWTLGMWNPAILYGTPESYYVQNYDPDTGMQLMGEYPYFGRVEVLFNMRYYEKVDDKLTFHTMPLTTNTLLNVVVPIMLQARGISWMKTKAAAMELQRQEEEEKTRMIERHLQDNAPAFGGSAISFSRQGVRSTEIDKRMIEMQRMWNTLAKAASELPKGMSTR
jgi:hypothetical protein